MSFPTAPDDGHQVQFQIPAFMCSTAPTLAPGGGAEVIPVGLLSDHTLANTWFSSNGFTPHSFNEQYTEQQGEPQNCVQSQQSSSAPFDFDSYVVPTAHPAPALAPPQPRIQMQAELAVFMQPQPPPFSDLSVTSPLGLPVYSASGFDILSILAKVVNRPHPRVSLGPVDLTCSFVVVDVRRYDHPIVYCSPSFCQLTGYAENEILGRNCRFLQAPNGQVQRGERRQYTSHDAVAHLKKNLSADKECQTAILNFKKDGTAFMNLVTVIPVSGGPSGASHEEPEVVYHVGFQVDLTKQPHAILEKLRDGSYVVDYTPQHNPASQQSSFSLHDIGQTKDRKQLIPSARISRELKKLLSDPSFVKSIPISSTTTISPSQSSSANKTGTDNAPYLPASHNSLLHLMLLEASPDFIHVVSLKGTFLYVAPSVRRVLGYESEEMVGKSISDYTHPEDVVPLMRELKEGSATGLAAAGGVSVDGTDITAVDQAHHSVSLIPRTVDLLFRARTKAGVYVWVECKGRLHVEPGKGRKAIVLSGRAKEMPRLEWNVIARAGGLNMPIPGHKDHDGVKTKPVETEVWGTITSGHGGGMISFLVVGATVTDILGWTPSDMIGRDVTRFVLEGGQQLLEEIRAFDLGHDTCDIRKAVCRLQHKDGSSVDSLFILYRPQLHDMTGGTPSAPLIYQIKFGKTQVPGPLIHPLTASIFEELDIGHDSSWQYELQQIRFSNQRLEDEIATLEKQIEEARDAQLKALDEIQYPPTNYYPQPSSPLYHRRNDRVPVQEHTHQQVGPIPIHEELSLHANYQYPSSIDPGGFVQTINRPQPNYGSLIPIVSSSKPPSISLETSLGWEERFSDRSDHTRGRKRRWDNSS